MCGVCVCVCVGVCGCVCVWVCVYMKDKHRTKCFL